MTNPNAPSAGRMDERPTRSIAFAFGFLAAALLVFALFYGVYAWNSVYREKMAELRNLTDLAARSSNMFFRRYEQVLPLLGQDLFDDGAAAGPPAVRALLARYHKAQPELTRINLFDVDANLIASSGEAEPAAVKRLGTDPAFRDSFGEALRRDGLVISRVIYGVFVQDWIIPLRMRVLDPRSGRTAFVLSAVVRLDNQQALWRGLHLPPQAAIGLVRNDGFPLSRLPLPVNPADFYATPGRSAVWQYMSEHGFPDAGEVDAIGGVDHLPRLTVFHRLADYPVAAYVTVPRTAFWTAWRERVQVPVALFALSLAGLIFAGAWTSRQQAARERDRDAAEAALRTGAAELKRQTALLAQTQHAARIGGWELDLTTNQLYWTEETYRIHETTAIEFKPTVEQAIAFYAPESRAAIRSAVETAVRTGDPWDLELEVVTAHGRRIWVRATGTAELDPAGMPLRLSGAFQDVTERRRADDRIRRLAHYDDLTGLANRNLFSYHLSRALSHADRYHERFSLLFIDLDRFKNINDSLGHDVGDSVLKIIGQRLTDSVRAADLVARFGGDEFVVIAEEVATPEDAAGIARKLLAKIEEPVFAQGQEFILTASIGIATFPDDGRDMQTLVKHADIAMYRAKERGTNTFEFYTSGADSVNVERLSLESRLKRAVSDMSQFVLHYQPKISVAQGHITGVEALVRWVSPDRGMVPPSEFIPLAEETGLIGAIGEWVLDSACRQSLAWGAAGLPPVRIAVNISARQLYADHFVAQVHRILADTGVDPGSIELEITESVMMQNVQQMVERLAETKQLGLRIAIDDFGTGYSSLAYLKRLPIDCLKVDRSFVQDLLTDADDATITRAVIALAHSLRLEVVAEGVETEAQFEFLRDLGCDQIQGYLFSKPLPAAEVEELLRRGAHLIIPTQRDAA